ncbi:glucosyltransferase domain-containing protein [Enterobacter soli]|uniref:glucosyltransferase domain-containing protein n=1 Tax=Enterobacter soli TaxID=885040 RepID=UPI0021496A98|nr:glucosyltransferase domain-containing protein [Enterobacter soli]MCR1317367.1 glucosyltransferase domain-containing protein [Enterobacter soli]
MAPLPFFLPFILNNYAFNDDFYKQLWGQSHFMQDGRPIAEVVLRIFSFSHFSVDNVAPLTWMLSITLLGWVCTYLSSKLNISGEKPQFLFTALVFCTPAFIENAFFKYDNLTMSIALALSVIASSIIVKNRRSFSLVYLLCLGFLCSYQLAMTSFIILSLLMFIFKEIKEGNQKGGLWELIFKAIALTVAFATYVAIKPLMPISKYAMEQGTILPPEEIITNITAGVVKYTTLLFSIYDTLSLIALTILAAISVGYLISYSAKKLKGNASFYEYAAAFVMIVSVPLSFIMIFAPLMILKSQPDYLRLLIGLGAFIYMITFLAYRAASSVKYAKSAVLILALIPMIDAISKSYIINNAYSAQHNFSNGISVGVLNSLSTAGIDDISEIKYTTHGPVAYETERVMKDYPFTKKLLRGGFVAIPHWAGYEHQAKIKVGEWVTDNQTKDACSGTSIAKHINYDIYINNKIAFVDLTKSRCKTDK